MFVAERMPLRTQDNLRPYLQSSSLMIKSESLLSGWFSCSAHELQPLSIHIPGFLGDIPWHSNFMWCNRATSLFWFPSSPAKLVYLTNLTSSGCGHIPGNSVTSNNKSQMLVSKAMINHPIHQPWPGVISHHPMAKAKPNCINLYGGWWGWFTTVIP